MGPGGSLPNIDNPRHDEIRAIVQPAFLPRRIGAHEDAIRAVILGHIAGWADRGTVDLAQELAWPTPFDVFFRLMGLPAEGGEERAQLERWVHELKGREPGTPHLSDVARVATAGIRDYFVRLLEDRRRAPRDDLVSTIVHATHRRRAIHRRARHARVRGPGADDGAVPGRRGVHGGPHRHGVQAAGGEPGPATHPARRPVADPRGRRGGRPLGDAAPADGANGDAGHDPARRHDPGAQQGGPGRRRRQQGRSPVRGSRPVRRDAGHASATSGSGRASTGAWAHTLPGSRPGSRLRRRCPCSASTSWPARPCSTRARPTCTCGGDCRRRSRRGGADRRDARREVRPVDGPAARP